MRTLLRVNWWLVLLIVCAGSAFAQQGQNTMTMQRGDMKVLMERGQNALGNYTTYAITEQNFKTFGFRSLEEARAATVGPPIRVAVIGHKALKKFKSEKSAKLLFEDSDTQWFPVLVNGETKTKMELVRIEDKWVPGELGGIAGPKKVQEARTGLSALLESAGIRGTSKPVLVRIPVLLATFLYTDSPDGEFLIPAMVQPERFRLQDGTVHPADEVLSNLKEMALKIKEGTLH